MTVAVVEPVGVAIDYDRSVWLAGPAAGSEPEAIELWIAGAQRACLADFEIGADTAEATYLRALLTNFATADLGCEFRFLRLRALDDEPLVVRLNLLTLIEDDDEVASALDVPFLDDERSADDGMAVQVYDRAPQVEVLDEGRGLSRRVWYRVDEGLRPLVRHHRRVRECGVDIIVSCLLPSMKGAVLGGVADLDEFARSVWILDAEGGRW